MARKSKSRRALFNGKLKPGFPKFNAMEATSPLEAMERYNRERLRAADSREPLDFRLGHAAVTKSGGAAVERLARTLPDAEGRIGHPYRAFDTLAALHRNGTINNEDHDAGRQFEEDFALAGLDPLHARDLRRIPGQGCDDLNDAMVGGRLRVRRAMERLGGPMTPVGSAVWCILGSGQTLREWAASCQFGQAGRSLDEKVAKGIFLAGLGLLSAHYGTGKTSRRGAKAAAGSTGRYPAERTA